MRTFRGRDCLRSQSSTLKKHAVVPKKKICKFLENNARLSHPRGRCSSLLSQLGSCPVNSLLLSNLTFYRSEYKSQLLYQTVSHLPTVRLEIQFTYGFQKSARMFRADATFNARKLYIQCVGVAAGQRVV